MAYFLRIHKRPKGLYLQIDESFRNKEKKRTDHKSYKSLGYINDLIASGIDDPISHFKREVEKLNIERKEQLNLSKIKKIGDFPALKNIGHFLIKSVLDKLNVDPLIDIMCRFFPFNFEASQLLRMLIYARIVKPCSKLKTVEDVFPSLYKSYDISINQIYDAIEYIGNDYKKFIEIFNHQIDRIYGRKTDTVFFDCTNYYFEIDLPKDDKQKGPSKENRNCPIISQALLLDANQIPLAMEMFPGNESEKPYIRNIIKDMKTRYDITGKTVQVADKGLNCAQNIYEALKNGDGYVFSKSIHGKNLSDVEKTWILLPNDYIDVKDENGNVKFKVKECIDTFTYYLTDENGKRIPFKVREKRVVSYNPTLAKKQQAEIKKQVEKVSSLNTLKAVGKSEYGDAIRYVSFKDKIKPELNLEKIKEDLDLCGYNLIVTSEICKSAKEIYEIYHGLWRIEESFRITKSFLDARPVYLQKKESIYGHFLICYLSLVVLRILEFKVFNQELNSYDIIDFIRSYNVSEGPNNIYINNARKSIVFDKIKTIFNLDIIDNAFLTKKDIEKVYSAKF